MSCEFCERFDFSTAKIEVDKYNARILLSLCNTKFDQDEQFNFCPKCGRKLTKVLWDLFIEDHPSFRFEVNGYPDCPCDYGYINDNESICEEMGYSCVTCWNRSVNDDRA